MVPIDTLGFSPHIAMPAILLFLTMLLNMSADFADRRAAQHASPYEISLWAAILQLLLILPFIGLVGTATALQVMLCVLIGAVSAIGRIPWYRALAIHGQQLSKLAPYLRLSSVFVLLLAFMVLGETLTTAKAGGAALIVTGSLLVTLDRPRQTLAMLVHNGRAVGLIAAFSLSTALIAVLYKALLNAGVGIWTIFFYLKASQAATLVLLAARNPLNESGFLDATNIRLFTLARLVQTVAALIYLTALRDMDLSSVEPIMALSPFCYLVIERVLLKLQPGSRIQTPSLRHVPATRLTALHAGAVCVVTVGSLLMYLR
jgi:drug/metabolite transporter (DMT)-like permease